MPANYSAISAEEMTYVNGGYTGNLFGMPKALSTLSTNVINIVANTFVPRLVADTLGVMFSGTYKIGGVWDALKDGVTGGETGNTGKGEDKYNNTWAGAAMQIVGGLFAVAQLANNDVPTYTANNQIKITG